MQGSVNSNSSRILDLALDKFSFEYDLCLQGQVPKGDIGQVGTATSAARTLASSSISEGRMNCMTTSVQRGGVLVPMAPMIVSKSTFGRIAAGYAAH